MNIVCIRREAGDKRGNGRFVRLPSGETERLGKQVGAQTLCRIACDAGSHAVRDDIPHKPDGGACEHSHAPQGQGEDIFGGGDIVDHMRHNERQDELCERSCGFDEKAERHAPFVGRQIVKECLQRLLLFARFDHVFCVFGEAAGKIRN